MMFFSATTNGFYVSGIHTSEQIPADAVEISEAQHAELMLGQENGLMIIGGPDGYPRLVERPLPKPPTRDQQKAARRLAYASESDPLFFMSQRGEATVEEWQAKIAEIKARYPYPAE